VAGAPLSRRSDDIAGACAMENPMKALLSLVIPALALGLATARAADRQPVILAQNAPEVCTEVYQPVCGTDRDGKRVTYSNACFARAAKATEVKPGECPK
jgi:hypothetical protein